MKENRKQQALDNLKEVGKELTRIEQISALLGWDQETYMPKGGIIDRAEHQAVIKGWEHSKITDPSIGEALKVLGIDIEVSRLESAQFEGLSDLSVEDRAFVREIARLYRREKKIPKEIVEKLARETSISQSRWVEAKERNDFSLFAPSLESVVGIEKEISELVGYETEPYDALLDAYEPWMTTKALIDVFGKFESDLRAFIKRITSAETGIDDSFLYRDYNIRKQEAFGREVLESMGFDFNNGRLDISAHPFTTTIGFSDIRLTTRYNESNFKDAIFSIIHEGGHGLYEQGFPEKLRGNILANGASMGIHESQSRLWENIIGRSLSFWIGFYPRLLEYFGDELKGISVKDFYRAVNTVTPSLIRVLADEVTYNLHIMIRFKIERALLNNEISINEVPRLWNSEYEYLLGVVPSNDSEGVLQDIHWSLGYFGYFPTYSLGNLYSAQFYRKMMLDIPNLDEEIERGNLKPVLAWLRENIHRYGQVYPAHELCERVTGEKLDSRYFMEYLYNKYEDIYNLS